ncbi:MULTISPECIES: hypothetical protein [Pseudomonas]|uniref:hypothetical protein n=1 Tax=Pseudomonas TaxID=286 RepID=UPI001E59D54B|nr:MULTISPECIES: hypothetical protein [Pseudomonas]MCE1116816.1 hypothetical protein [Pseudomonas sp. NMI795_08]
MNMLKTLTIACVISLPLQLAQAAPVDACDAKLAQLESIERSEGVAVQGGLATDIRRLVEQAKAAKAKGDGKACLSAASRALSLYKTASK